MLNNNLPITQSKARPVSLDNFLSINKKSLDLPGEDVSTCNSCELRRKCKSHISRIKITRLVNMNIYDLDYVFIIHFNAEFFCLAVINGGKVLLKEFHSTIHLARLSFLRWYGVQKGKALLNPNWETYSPCHDWLLEMFAALGII